VPTTVGKSNSRTRTRAIDKVGKSVKVGKIGKIGKIGLLVALGLAICDGRAGAKGKPARKAGQAAARAPGAGQTEDSLDEADRERAGAPLELGPATLAKLRVALSDPDDDVVLETVKTLATGRAVNASVPLVELLAVGTTPRLAVATLHALEKLAQPRTADIVLAYAGHRDPHVRKAALEALGALPDPRVGAVLLARLGDEDESVRGVAAGLAARRLKAAAAPRLRALLESKDPVAAAPLGQVAPVAQLQGLLDLRGRVPDADFAILLGEVLKRGDVPDPTRVDIVKALADVPGADATTALAEYVGDSAGGGSGRPSRALAKKMLDERGKNP
jgi:HEAT repeat protein